MSARERRKGASGELEVVEILRSHGWVRAHRNFGSGSQGGGDIAHGPARCHLEIKRVEKLNVPAAVRQAAADAAPTDVPIVVHRPSRSGWMATLPLDELLALLRLREVG